MRRVVVTGLGAVTPLGLDAQSTWDAAVAGHERGRLDPLLRRERLPGAHRLGGQGLRAGGGRRAEGRAAARAERRARGRGGARGMGGCRRRGHRSRAGRDPGRLRDRRRHRDPRAGRGPPRTRPQPRLAVVPPERARRLGDRADRDRSRAARPELRAGLGMCHGLARRRRGGGDDPARRRRRRARGRHRGLHAPGDPGRLLRDARARRRGGGPDARVTSVRRHARRLRHGRGRVRDGARGATSAPSRAAPGSTRRCSGTGPPTTPTTWRSPTRSPSASRR